MIRPDDPRVTAYALDEGDLADRRAVEAAIAVDPEVAAAVEAVRATAREARGAFEAARAEGLDPAQRAAVLDAARATADAPLDAGAAAAGAIVRASLARRWAPFVTGLAAAAGLLVALSLGLSGGGGAAAPAERTRTVGRASDLEGDGRASSRPGGSLAMPQGDVSAPYAAGRAPQSHAGSTPSGEAEEAADTRRRAALREPRDATPAPTPAGPAPGAALEGPPRAAGPVGAPSAPPPLSAPPPSTVVPVRTPSTPLPGPTVGLVQGEWSRRAEARESLDGVEWKLPALERAKEAYGFVEATRPDGTTTRVRVVGRLVAETGGLALPVGGGVRFEAEAKVGPLAPGTTFPSLFECVEHPPAGHRWVRIGDAYVLVSTSELPPTVAPSSGEAYDEVVESPFLRAADAPLSTFSVDVDTASYSNVRRMLRSGQRPPKAAVRVEELVNYFPYAYAAPTGPEPFAVHLEASTCPWNVKHQLVRVGIKGREVEKAARPPMNLVFLVDVSGSMNAPNKLPLVQASMRMLLEDLAERDHVAIVVYAGASGLVLPPTSCERKDVIQAAIDALRPGGSTNGAAGITLAYDVAMQRFEKDAVNRVVLATDGDFNVGVTSREALLALITEKARSGVFLTCLGYGMGNLKDATLEMLADKGNGNYGYVDSTKEARKVLVEGAAGTLVTIAKDVKLQVEFNPAVVASYRLVGYDNRRLAARDFADDRKDAGEVGAGHTVTALYEVVPVGAEDVATGVGPDGVEPLRYGPKPPPPPPVVVPGTRDPGPVLVEVPEMLTVKVRWKEPTGTTSVKREFPLLAVVPEYAKASPDFKFAAAVASFAMLLKGSAYAGTATFDAVEELAGEGLGFDPSGYRKELLELVAAAKALPR